MKRKNSIDMGFFDMYMVQKTRRQDFFNRVNKLIDWDKIEFELNKIYKKGNSVDGRPAYSGLLLFKMLLIEIWYDMSDVECEDFVRDSLSARLFLGLSIEDDVPDHSTLSRFRSELAGKRAYDRLLRKINKQLEQHGAKLKKGKTIVDASITVSPLAPKGKTTYEIAEDRKEDERQDDEMKKEETHHRLIKKESPGVDDEARWLKKQDKLFYGYKQSIAVDENGMIDAVTTVSANVNDSKTLAVLLSMLPQDRKEEILADKGFKTPENDELLKQQNIKNRIMDKAYRNRPLSQRQIQRNKLISKYRYVVERTFGSIKRWFGGHVARYKGFIKTHAQHVLQAIAYNLKRSINVRWV